MSDIYNLSPNMDIKEMILEAKKSPWIEQNKVPEKSQKAFMKSPDKQ